MASSRIHNYIISSTQVSLVHLSCVDVIVTARTPASDTGSPITDFAPRRSLTGLGRSAITAPAKRKTAFSSAQSAVDNSNTFTATTGMRPRS